MTFYKAIIDASNPRIEQVEAVRATPNLVYLKKDWYGQPLPTKLFRTGRDYKVCDTFEEAKQHIVFALLSELDEAKQRVERIQVAAVAATKLQPPSQPQD